MKKTERLGLALPEGSDYVSIETLNENFQKMDALVDLIEQRAQVVTGRYTGTGTYGKDAPNSLTFHKQPKFLVVQRLGDGGVSSRTPGLVVMLGQTDYATTDAANYESHVTLEWDGNTVSWYADSGSTNTSAQGNQLNGLNSEYQYLAIL